MTTGLQAHTAQGTTTDVAAATSLFGQLKCTGTPTYTATDDVTVTICCEYLD
jgi:hypothetical protein